MFSKSDVIVNSRGVEPGSTQSATKTVAILPPITPNLSNFAQFVIGNNSEPLLLTPTTCDSIERTLLELGSSQQVLKVNNTVASTQQPPPQAQQFPPQQHIVSGPPLKQEYAATNGSSDYTGDDSSNTNDDWDDDVDSVVKYNRLQLTDGLTDSNGTAARKATKSGRPTGPRQPRKHVTLSTEEEERRRLRRERNKQAAAKCRQKRVDLTNQLLAETECLESEQMRLQEEIRTYQREKDELEFILESHRMHCGAATVGTLPGAAAVVGTAVTSSVGVGLTGLVRSVAASNGIVVSSSATATAPSGGGGYATQLPHVAVASINSSVSGSTVKTVESSECNSIMSATPVTATAASLHQTAIALMGTTIPVAAGGVSTAMTTVGISRPNSFTTSAMRTIAMGMTPSGSLSLFTYGLDSLIDGHTGLTPITGIPSCSVAAAGVGAPQLGTGAND